MSTNIDVDFDTPEDALKAYYGDDYDPDENGPGGDGGGDESRWGELKGRGAYPAGGWSLSEQAHLDEAKSRFFVIRNTGGAYEALNSGGSIASFQTLDLGKLPNFSSESAANEAYNAWADSEGRQNGNAGDGDGDDTGQSENWTEWKQINEVAGWIIEQRDHVDEDRSQWIIGSKNEAGEDIWLGPGGEVVDSRHIYDSPEDVEKALQAYIAAEQRGDVADDDKPTGERVDRGSLPGGGGRGQGGSGPPVIGGAADAVGGVGNLLLLVALAAVVTYYLEREGHIDLVDSIGPQAGGVF